LRPHSSACAAKASGTQSLFEPVMRALLVLLGLVCANGLQIVPRRHVLQVGAAAAIGLPSLPVSAKVKSKVTLENKEELKAERDAMAASKGTRGVASAEQEARDTVVKNRNENKGLVVDAQGRKVVVANRNRDPAELGLKQWGGD